MINGVPIIIFTERRLLNALFLALQKSRKLYLSQENEETVDVHIKVYLPAFIKTGRLISMGFCVGIKVARFN